MQVNWKSPSHLSPFLFSKTAEWQGVKLRHVVIMEGEMPEQILGKHEINITLAGSLSMTKQNPSGNVRKACSGPGNVCFTPAGQPVGAMWERELENMAIMIDPVFLRDFAYENHFSSGFELTDKEVKSDPLIQHVSFALLNEASAVTPSQKLYTDSLIQTLNLHMLKNYSTAEIAAESAVGGLSGYRLRRVKEFIHANLEKDLSLIELSEVAGLSRFHFSRAFRSSVGATPQQYVMQQRIELAKQLLIKEDLPLVEIGFLAGFKNQSHFTSLFRKFTSLTPKTWRELKHA